MRKLIIFNADIYNTTDPHQRIYIDISDLNLCGSMAMLSFGPKIAIVYSGY